MLKRIITIVLTVCMLFLICTQAMADNTLQDSEFLSDREKCAVAELVPNISADRASKLTVSELNYAASIAETDEDANTIYEALLDKYQADANLSSTSSLISSYVTVTSVTKSGTTTTVNYKIIATVPSGASINLGYEFPAVTRTAGKSILISGKAKGSYSETFTIPALMCQHRVFSKLTARNYSETKVWALYNFSTAKSVDYHTITAAEVAGYWTVYVVAPYLIVKINPASKILQIAGKVASIGNTSVAVASSFNLNVGVPTPVKGQYYRTETWYIDNQIYCRVTVWQNKAAFDNGSSPLYIGTKYVQSNLPTF